MGCVSSSDRDSEPEQEQMAASIRQQRRDVFGSVRDDPEKTVVASSPILTASPMQSPQQQARNPSHPYPDTLPTPPLRQADRHKEDDLPQFPDLFCTQSEGNSSSHMSPFVAPIAAF